MPNLNETPLSTEKALLKRLHKAQAVVEELTVRVAELEAQLDISESNHARLREWAQLMTKGFRGVYKLSRL